MYIFMFLENNMIKMQRMISRTSQPVDADDDGQEQKGGR